MLLVDPVYRGRRLRTIEPVLPVRQRWSPARLHLGMWMNRVGANRRVEVTSARNGEEWWRRYCGFLACFLGTQSTAASLMA